MYASGSRIAEAPWMPSRLGVRPLSQYCIQSASGPQSGLMGSPQRNRLVKRKRSEDMISSSGCSTSTL
eukprot:8740270-Ditylum_brightwellii.AAC.1